MGKKGFSQPFIIIIIIAIIVTAIIIGYIYYTDIKKSCHDEAMAKQGPGISFNLQKFQDDYQNCLHRHGIP